MYPGRICAGKIERQPASQPASQNDRIKRQTHRQEGRVGSDLQYLLPLCEKERVREGERENVRVCNCAHGCESEMVDVERVG